MLEENEDVVEADSSPVDEQIEDSSPSETQDEDATSEQATEKTEKEVPFHEHPRWQEVQAQKQKAEQAASEAKAQAEYYKGLAEGQKPKEAVEDPYDGLTTEEKSFWKQSDARTQNIVDKKVQAALAKAQGEYQRDIQGYQSMVGNVIATNFIEKHPDVKKGSAEMEKIVTSAQDLAGRGIDLTQALEMSYRDTMFDKKAQMEVDKVKKEKAQKTQEKLKANVETSGVSQEALKTEDMSIDKTFDEAAKDLGVTI